MEPKRVLKIVLKAVVVVLCVIGYLYQTYEFLELYFTYPTVVDIQVSMPSDIDIPAISICSTHGIYPAILCKSSQYCTPGDILNPISVCDSIPEMCRDNKPPANFTAVHYEKYFEDNNISNGTSEVLRIPLKSYLECSIVSGSGKRACDGDVILGSYYSKSRTPNFCYTLFSHWKNPNAKVQTIKKSETIQLSIHVDCSFRANEDLPASVVALPQYNCMGYPGAQMSIHSRNMVDSPFDGGKSFSGEKRLLPPPYQTNCTDYNPAWAARGGVGPLNQLMVIEECRLNASLQKLGCVPFFINYPHNETICKYCEDCPEVTQIGHECAKQLDHFNQPCDSIEYIMSVKESVINIEKVFSNKSVQPSEVINVKEKSYNCTFDKKFSKQCQSVLIEIGFNDYEIQSMTYNAKFESVELFSVIGGYMGMYLGISIVAVYDFFEALLLKFLAHLKRRQRHRKKLDANRTKIDPWSRHQKWDDFAYPYSSVGLRKRWATPPRDMY
ncbi:hypothetical protein JTE90_015280 [Oedothorax gibbosus]|uniref:Uncharacterized protein n=1 Tax=Oedothorax gibbosus TaxID=931172 RepID=A0AAV6UCS7_9ARAC|nr:hypothetical protein JTE90_015280 [Oedothorax gibbosus]